LGTLVCARLSEECQQIKNYDFDAEIINKRTKKKFILIYLQNRYLFKNIECFFLVEEEK